MAIKTTRLFVFSDVPGKWLALIESLENRRAHISISPIPYEYYLRRNIDLTYPFYHSSYVILTSRQESPPSLGAFLQPFSWDTWFVIFLILNAAALFETFFEWHSPYGLTPKGRRRQEVFSLASALTLSWSIIFSHTFKTKSPKCWSNRFLGNVWGGFGIVFIAIYTAKLASFMVELGDVHVASDVQGIIDICRTLHNCRVGVVPNTSDEEYLKKYYSNSLYQHIQYIKNYSVGIDSLKNQTITFMLMDHSIARYYTTRDVSKSKQISGDNFGTFGVSLGFSKYDNELKENITDILLSYMDKGIIQRLHDEWYGYENCEFKRLSKNRKLSFVRFFGVFILLGGGVLIGLLTLTLEWITFKYFVPYWRQKQWPGWMFCSQRLYATLNVPDDVFEEAYYDYKCYSFKEVGERLHNYSTRSDSLDLRVVDIPKLLSTTYRLKREIDNLKQTISLTPYDISDEQQESPLSQFVEEIPLLEQSNDIPLRRTSTQSLFNKNHLNKFYLETQGTETTANIDKIAVTVDQRIQVLENELDQLKLKLICVANEKEELRKELNNVLSNHSI
ncbi:unnamed protein product [Didymodactylos carnosus]|uniref:Ionotropic glutamate receptor C-terminal domain-containing protein n=1 Tax=Didymodactylos carnosus TaxID=1234261 RepID=A0A815WBM3_9BILA|nr:unnamed protein product [Didymodactylos carnosus]CAF4400152.1 unnamed protein product [Didymodactylos carnosus]